MSADLGIKGDFRPRQFATTRWSLILTCASSTATQKNASDALAELCQIYWRPVFAFICRCGHSVSDAQDLTQDFFLMIIDGKLLKFADPSRGRFRSLLLKALQNFLRDDYDRRNAKKRGGNRRDLPLHDWIAEAPSRLSVSHELTDWSPEKVFDFRWAATMTERALGRLARECENCGRQRMFSTLSKYLMSDRGEVSYASLAVSLGVAESAVKRLLHHLRGRYRAILRDEVAQTVETTAEIEDEIRYLCAVLAAGGT